MDNGDKLMLNLSLCHFATYKPENIFELSYAELVQGKHETVYNDETTNTDFHYFNIHNVEYFPKTEKNNALSAFNKRLTSSNPFHESDMGWDLNKLLTKEKT